ncbi:ribonuclease E [Nocardioides exalbidus]|uniref:Ribonuclease E n=1 Tax=Nocardioides exalbidus TaxID=402596 RepID=A0A1H4JED5_9ACTN|nr:Rne/Rng family ribonuclease [Nocardioides exalbidus]SEB44684.1 ribonuclease E [Nocardioides exalbidus]
MLDDDQPDRTDAANAAPSAPTPDAPAEASPPVVTRRTRKAPAKKAAAAPAVDAPAADAAEPAAEEPAAPAKKAAARKAPARKAAPRKAAAKKAATAADVEAPELEAAIEAAEAAEVAAPAKKAAARKTAKAPAKKTAARKSAAKKTASPEPVVAEGEGPADEAPADDATGHAVLFQAPVVTTTTRRARKRPTPVPVETATDTTGEPTVEASVDGADEAAAPAKKAAAKKSAAKKSSGKKSSGKRGKKADQAVEQPAELTPDDEAADEEATDPTDGESVEPTEAATDSSDDSSDEDTDGSSDDSTDDNADDNADDEGPARRRRRRGGRRRRKSSDSGQDGSQDGDADSSDDAGEAADADSDGDSATSDNGDANGSANGNGNGDGDGTSRRRRRRRRAGDDAASDDDEPNTVTRVRSRRSAEDQITAVSGSTRLEAKKQRRREGREAGRRRAPIVSEAEFLARRESVDRVMVIRQRHDLTQIGVLEDRVLVEHYVARESQTSLIGNVYLGRVQNVLPSMEAAFIDIGKGRNAVLYAGEVNWQSLGHKEGQPRKIESVLSSGQMVLVQVTKDPIGHKGARLTSQVSLAGRFLVYVPDGTTSGISRKLPDTERNRLKTLLKEIVPDTAGVIVRTAAEGASEEELTRDVERLKSRWEEIEKKSSNKGSGPQLLYGEPDLTLKVVRDLFTEDFSKLVIEGDDAWNTVRGYVESVAPDLAERVEKYERNGAGDVFSTYRIDEQIHKGLDRKVWLPSGGSLIIDRTEAMTVVDVNTGKFTGSGGNLEETVTKNNLEAAEEIVRQLRLRDIGGIIVVDFIDMVLESNRDLVVRRLVECLGRDRTRHQVAEVTSLGLVQMTRKRIGTGLLEAFSENCEHCHGRGVVIKDQPVDPNGKGSSSDDAGEGRRSSRRRGRRGASGEGNDNGDSNGGSNGGDKPVEHHHAPSPKDVAAMARHDKAADEATDEATDEVTDEVTDEPTGESTDAPTDEPTGESTDAPTDEPTDEVTQEATPADETPAAPAEVEVVAEVEAPAEEAVAEAPVEAPAEPEKPRVVTRTRRRSASRPAGPPATLSAAAPIGDAGTPPGSGIVEPVAVDVDPGVGTPLASGSEDAAAEAESEAPAIEHVPIKKKGSRKR